MFLDTRGAQPFRYCQPHYVYFHDLRRSVSSVLLPRTEPTLLSHVCLTIFLLNISYTVDKRVHIKQDRHNIYFK